MRVGKLCLLVLSFISFIDARAAYVPKKRPFDVRHYRLAFTVDPSTDPSELRAEVEIQARLTERARGLSLDIDSLKIHNVRMRLGKDWRGVKFGTTTRQLEVTFPKRLPKGTSVTLRVDYSAPIETRNHYGLFKVTDPDEPQRGTLLFTQLEAEGARRVFPANDEPYDKATTEVHAIVPTGIEVISNGRRTRDNIIKIKGKNWRQIHWLQDKPHSTYLVSLAVGKFKQVVQSKSPLVDVWVGDTKTEKVRFVAGATRKMIKFIEGYLGVPYPWDKYSTVGVPTFLWGGMENTSSTHMNQERTVLNDPESEIEKNGIVGLAAHELAHQWFGDYVTMQWWDDLWLNEAFASYLGTVATKHIFPGEEHDIGLVTYTWDAYFRQEDGPRSHPIVNHALKDPGEAFDSISYTKGENVLRMLNYYVGEESYRKGLGAYLRKHRLGNATYKDFFNAVAAASKQNLDAFRDSWLLQRGYPVLDYAHEWDKDKKIARLRITQRPNHEGDKSVFHFKIPVIFNRTESPEYATRMDVVVSGAETVVESALPAPPEWVTVNAEGIVLARLAPESLSEKELQLQAAKDSDPVSRVWANLRLIEEFLSGGNDETAERALLAAIENDPSPYVRIAVLGAVQKAKRRWLPEELGKRLLALADKTTNPAFERTTTFETDGHGWRQYRSNLLGTLGKIRDADSLRFLTATVQDPILPLDDLNMAARALAALGDMRCGEILRHAISVQEARGYRFKYWLQYAFGAYENPRAAAEIQRLSKTEGPDLLGRMGWLIRNNTSLRTSSEWASFLEIFLLHDENFGDEVKTRLLATVEDLKTSTVKRMLERVTRQTASTRIREATRAILDKNFG